MNKERREECSSLAKEIIDDFELLRLSNNSIIKKSLRLCRLLSDDDGIKLFDYELSGYPTSTDGHLTKDAWRIGRIAGRIYVDSGDKKERMKTILISTLENKVKTDSERLKVAHDPSVSVTSANPKENISVAVGRSKNNTERYNITVAINESSNTLNTISGNLYKYVLNIYYNLMYGNIIEDIFTKNRLFVNEKLKNICPEAIRKFVSVYENIDSNNPEDWANAVHSCRRILKDVADSLYKPSDEPIVFSNGKEIKIGEEQYINRLIQYIDNNSKSDTYNNVVGTTIEHIGERIDAIVSAVCKGTHTEVKKEEAERYIIYSYMLLFDVLSI